MRTPTVSPARFLFLAISFVGLCLGAILPQPASAWTRTTETYFLRFAGGPLLSPIRPTAMTAQFQDSPPLQRTTYHEIGVWTAAATDRTQRLAATTALQVWLGLKNRDGSSPPTPVTWVRQQTWHFCGMILELWVLQPSLCVRPA